MRFRSRRTVYLVLGDRVEALRRVDLRTRSGRRPYRRPALVNPQRVDGARELSIGQGRCAGNPNKDPNAPEMPPPPIQTPREMIARRTSTRPQGRNLAAIPNGPSHRCHWLPTAG